MKSRKAIDTLSIATKLVLPNDTNTIGNLFGGELLAWMDVIASVSAHRHCRRVVVTASVNHVSFKKPIKEASIVTLEAEVSRSFYSSMDVTIKGMVRALKVWRGHSKNPLSQQPFRFRLFTRRRVVYMSSC